MQLLWDKDASGGVKLGIPLVSVSGAAALFSFSAVEPFVFLRRLGDIGWDNLSTGEIEAGPFLAGAGGLLALLAPSSLWPFTRLRSPPPESEERSDSFHED